MIEPYAMDSEEEITGYLNDLVKGGRIQEAPEHLSRVAPAWKERFVQRARELGLDA